MSNTDSRFKFVNLGKLGRAGESTFSTLGCTLATKLIEDGWIPCGTSIDCDDQLFQTFYLPKEVPL